MGLADGIRTTYGQAAKEVRKKLDDFFAAYKQKAEQKLKQLQEGVISDEEYRRWMQSQMLTGRRWQEKLDDITKTYVDADKTARELVGDRSKNVFARFANSTARDIQNRFNGGVSFDMYDRHAVERLLTQNPRMLPERKINEAKDYRWNAKRVQNAVVQGIIQGEGIPQLTKRLTSELSASNAKHMTLFARTAMTGAQNAGRMERLHEAQDMGIVVKKKWLAAHDDRVRDAHAELDGQEVGIDEPFHSSLGDIMYPGDPTADPANIYNCRCTLTYVYDVKASRENLQEQEERLRYTTTYSPEVKANETPTKEVRTEVEKALTDVVKDFPMLDKHLETVMYGHDLDGAPASARADGKSILLDVAYFKDIKTLRNIIEENVRSGHTASVSNPAFIIAHECGHCIETMIAMRRLGLNDITSVIELEYVEAERKKLWSEYYTHMGFKNESFEEIMNTIRIEIGSYASSNPGELLANALGIWYYGTNKHPHVNKLMKYILKLVK